MGSKDNSAAKDNCLITYTTGQIWQKVEAPGFGIPGYIDVVLGIDICIKVIHQDGRTGPHAIPLAIDTSFGLVLSECAQGVVSCFSMLSTGDDLLRKFWEVENREVETPPLSLEEKTVVEHFWSSYNWDDQGGFIVALSERECVEPLK